MSNSEERRRQHALEKLRQICARWPEFSPLLRTCRTIEEMESAVEELRKMD